MTETVIVDDDDRCGCGDDGVATASALVLVQSQRAKNQKRRRAAHKKHVNARGTHTTQSAMQPGNQAAETAGSRLVRGRTKKTKSEADER